MSISRFKADLDRLTGGVGRVGVALSGGPDSVALLVLAHAALPGGIEAATVDHQLRAGSAQEAQFAARLCTERGIPHAILTPDAPITGNIQSAARTARYALLNQWADARDLAWIATAHHADDQLETLLMRVNRGAGIGGLAGVRARNGRIVRPLLGWRRAELAEVVRAAGIAAIDDPSNRDDRFDRARLRKVLAEADWLDPLSASRSASALAEAEAALGWAAQAYEGRRVAQQGGVVSFDPKNLPAELLRRIVLACLRRISPDATPRGEELDRLIAGLGEGRVATLAGAKCSGGDFWLFSAAPARQTK
jgi:tRNA(Ile)-lysidine synthase